MEKIKNILIVLAFVIASVALAFSVTQYLNKEKIAYIDINYVYENYNAKAERQVELDYMLDKQKTVLDSFEFDIKGLYDQYELGASKELENEIILKEKNYQRVYDEFSNISNEQRERFINEIMDQINTNVKTFGKENNYKLILGANGSGSLMYAQDEINVSDQVLKYLNSKYEGE